MPKVTSINIDGYELRFMSSDHMPPHFHWEKAGKWQVRVFFTRGGNRTFEIIFGTGPTGTEKRKMRALLENKLADLQEEWDAKVVVDEQLQKPEGAR